MAKRGETKEIIIQAATKVFFQNGYEKTSVKMILEEAHIVTGSFYHFFSSKESLFEAVVERFLLEYSERISQILNDETLDMYQILAKFLDELGRTSAVYFQELQGDKLHWTVQSALHDRTLEALVLPLSNALTRLRNSGAIKSYLDVDNTTLARILIKGMEAIIHSQDSEGMSSYQSDKIRADLMAYVRRMIQF